MQDFYGLSKIQMHTVEKRGVSVAVMFKSIKHFNPNGADLDNVAGDKIALMYFIDNKGDFKKKKLPHYLLAQYMFKNLNPSDKLQVESYLDWTLNGEPEEEAVDVDEELAEMRRAIKAGQL